jgi:glucose-6-phosphate isomerase
MTLVDVDFRDGIKATFVDNTKQLTQIHYDVNTLSSIFGGSRTFNTEEK